MTRMEDDQNGKRPTDCPTLRSEFDQTGEDQNGRRPKWKSTRKEDNQNERKMEDDGPTLRI